MPSPRAPAPSRRFERSRDYVQSLARGLAVLRTFDREHPAMTLAEISARAGLSRAAVRRLALTLQHLGYVRVVERDVSLTPRVLELGFSYLDSVALTELVQPRLEALSQRVHESCSMAVLDGQSIVYVARVPVRKLMMVALGVGARLPAFSSSMGRVLLSGLSEAELEQWFEDLEPVRHTRHTVVEPRRLRRLIAEVRQQGHAYVEQELELGLCSLAVPLRNREGRVAAALNIGMQYQPDARARALREFLPALRETAAAIERDTPSTWLPAVRP